MSIIFHIDVNSAFLSWTASRRLQEDPASVDLRTIPSIIGGDEKQRHGVVPGKQVTLAHVIASPDKDLYGKLGLIDAEGAIGIMTITPSEGAMIAADIASKSADIKVGFVDRFNGSLVITGDVAAVEVAIRDVMAVLCDRMGFAKAPVTKT